MTVTIPIVFLCYVYEKLGTEHYEMNYSDSSYSATHFMQCFLILKKTIEENMCYLDWNGQQQPTMGHY